MPDPDLTTLQPGDILVTLYDHWTIKRIGQTTRRTIYVLDNGWGTRRTLTAAGLPKIERVERAK